MNDWIYVGFVIIVWELVKRLPQYSIRTYFKIKNWMQKNRNSWEFSGICTVMNGNGEITTTTQPVKITFNDNKK